MQQNDHLRTDSGAGTSRVSRHPELEDWLNQRIFHPLAKRLAIVLAPTAISPNWVSVAGGVCVVLAGIAYTLPGWPLAAVAGLVLHLAWHVLDGADGDLARLTGKAGPLGEIVDGMADYISHIILYVMVAIMLSPTWGLMGWLLVAGAGISRAFQASHYEERRREYQWWVYGQSWIRNEPLIATNRTERVLVAAVAVYLALASRTAGKTGTIENLRRQAVSAPARLAAFRRAAKDHLCPLLRPLGLLSANYRTIALGFVMLMQRPVWFLVYELVLLNVVLMWSVLAQAGAARQISADLARWDQGTSPLSSTLR